MFGMIRLISAITRRCSTSSSMRMARELLGQQVAQQLGDEALFAEQHGGRPLGFAPALDLGPDLLEVRQVGRDVFFRAVGRGRADDDAARQARLLAELLHDRAQPPALVARFDLPRHADVIDRRHVDEEPAGQAEMRRDARALGAERLLHDLDDDFLAFLEQVLDLGGGRLALGTPAIAAAIVAGAPFGCRLAATGAAGRTGDGAGERRRRDAIRDRRRWPRCSHPRPAPRS